MKVSYTVPGKNLIGSFLQHEGSRIPCKPGLIIRSKAVKGNRKGKLLCLSCLQPFCFLESRQYKRRFPQLSLRAHYVNLCHFLSRYSPFVFYLYLQRQLLILCRNLISLYGKRGIGKSVPKGIAYLFSGCCFKIAVSHINIFLIKISICISKVCIRRIVLHLIGNGVGKLAGRVFLSCQHIHGSIAAYHSPLPCIKHRIRPIGIHKPHIHNIAYI